jgi:hypothetical protein
MKITYTEHAAPHLRGTTVHVQPALAASLVATGFAVAHPRPRYGTKEWLDERAEQSAHAGPPDAYDVVPLDMQRCVDNKFKTEPPNFPFTKK